MSEPTSAADTRAGEDLLAELTDDFLRRHRAGERPSMDEYAEKHPDFAEQIRDLFPAVIELEQPLGATGIEGGAGKRERLRLSLAKRHERARGAPLCLLKEKSALIEPDDPASRIDLASAAQRVAAEPGAHIEDVVAGP